MEKYNKKRFIELKNINFNTARTQFKYKRSGLKIVGAVGFMTFSFIVPDLSIGFILGVMLLSPVSLKYNIRNKYKDIKHAVNKCFILWGLK